MDAAPDPNPEPTPDPAPTMDVGPQDVQIDVTEDPEPSPEPDPMPDPNPDVPPEPDVPMPECVGDSDCEELPGTDVACIEATCRWVCVRELVDANGDLGPGGDGCECSPTEEGLELACDGQDNNCDGRADENCCLDASPWSINISPSDGSFPKGPHALAVSDNNRIGVVWENIFSEPPNQNETEVRFRAVDLQGAQLGSEGRFNDDSNDELRPKVVWDGEAFLITWQETRPGNIRRVEAVRRTDLGVVAPSSFSLNIGQSINLVDHAVFTPNREIDQTPVWIQSHGGGVAEGEACVGGSQKCVQMRADNNFVRNVDGFVGAGTQSSLSLTMKPDQWMMAWKSQRTSDTFIKWAPVDPEDRLPRGSIFGSSEIGDVLSGVSVATTNSGFLMAFTEDEDGTERLQIQPLTHNGIAAVDPLGLDSNGNDQIYPLLATLGDGALVVWAEDRGELLDIKVARVDETGALVGSVQTLQTEVQVLRDFIEVAAIPGIGAVVSLYRGNNGGYDLAILNRDAQPLCFDP